MTSENFSHLRNCALILGKHFSSLRRIAVRLSSDLISPNHTNYSGSIPTPYCFEFRFMLYFYSPVVMFV